MGVLRAVATTDIGGGGTVPTALGQGLPSSARFVAARQIQHYARAGSSKVLPWLINAGEPVVLSVQVGVGVVHEGSDMTLPR